MKKLFKYIPCLLVLPLLATACTEPECYREHLHVYTKDYIAVCEGGYWKDYCINREQCHLRSDYSMSQNDIDIVNRLSGECPVMQCIRNHCECTKALSREDIVFEQLIDLVDESVKGSTGL